ncbi:Abi family protein [Sporosarcina aquimarina]|uniref:Abi family protein n=1 Tax=Sporosarcina aquimarina TaxID=114975 RepID=UPI001C8DC51D|nr:Abi family protein [Sporosarcina aquimarina]MBY0221620.1 Abi family protein [Sporosarcina aquimarina]
MDPTEINIKEPTTYEQQMEILKERNLIIHDEGEALSFLKRVNYYRFSAYGLTLRHISNRDVFQDGITFHHMKMLYNFDQKLRDLLMNQLEFIEIEFRSKIAYQHAHEFGALGYRHTENFSSEGAHNSFLEELDKQIDRSGRELFVMHHRQKYGGEFPFWVAIEVISFGELSKLFRNLKEDTKNEVVKDFNIPYYYVESWLHSLAYVRNVCAHYGRLYGKKLTIKPTLFKKKRSLISNSGVFAAIYVLSRLLHQENRTNFITSLQALLEEYAEYIDLGELGFSEEWEKRLRER